MPRLLTVCVRYSSRRRSYSLELAVLGECLIPGLERWSTYPAANRSCRFPRSPFCTSASPPDGFHFGFSFGFHFGYHFGFHFVALLDGADRCLGPWA